MPKWNMVFMTYQNTLWYQGVSIFSSTYWLCFDRFQCVFLCPKMAMIESSNLQKSFKCSRHRFRRAIKRILPQNQMCKSTGWMTIVWLINPQPSNQLVAQGQIQSVWAALKAVLRLHTSHLQDPSAVRPHLIPYRWPNWPKKDMERAFWRYVIRRTRFRLLLTLPFPRETGTQTRTDWAWVMATVGMIECRPLAPGRISIQKYISSPWQWWIPGEISPVIPSN